MQPILWWQFINIFNIWHSNAISFNYCTSIYSLFTTSVDICICNSFGTVHPISANIRLIVNTFLLLFPFPSLTIQLNSIIVQNKHSCGLLPMLCFCCFFGSTWPFILFSKEMFPPLFILLLTLSHDPTIFFNVILNYSNYFHVT